MDTVSVVYTFIAGIVIAVIAYVVGEMIMNRPKIIVPSSNSWTESKQVNTYLIRDYSSDTDYRVEKELKTRDYYNFYGIQIKNEKWIISGVSASITRAAMKLWNSKGAAVTDWYEIRLWGGRKNSSNEPLFPGNMVNPGRVIGEGEELDLVIAYNQENTPKYYIFSIESHLKDNFMLYKDLFKEPMPYHGVIKINGHRINKKIYLSIVEGENNKLEINILSKKEFPLSEEEIT